MRICPTCGKEFKVFPCVDSMGRGKVCSKPCRPYQGAGNPKWRGGRVKEKSGRVKVYAPDHPDARLDGGKYIYEYRLVAEQKIGRPLTDDEIVHHLNNNPADNRPENLEVMTQAQHASLHMKGRYRGGPKL